MSLEITDIEPEIFKKIEQISPTIPMSAAKALEPGIPLTTFVKVMI